MNWDYIVAVLCIVSVVGITIYGVYAIHTITKNK